MKEIHEMLTELFKSSDIEIRIYTLDEEEISQDWVNQVKIKFCSLYTFE